MSLFAEARAEDIPTLFETYRSSLTSMNADVYKTYLELEKDNPKLFDAVNTLLEKAEYSTKDDVCAALTEHTVMVCVRNMSSYTEFMPFIRKINNAVGLDLAAYNGIKKPHSATNVDKAVVENKNKYDTSADLVRYFSEQIDAENSRVIQQKPSGGGSGGGSGGSSGIGSGGGAGYAASHEAVQSEDTKPAEQVVSFSDLSGYEWCRDAVNELAARGVIAGDGDGSFRPSNAITREEMLKMLLAAFEIYDGIASVEFLDVRVTDWFYPYVATAYKLGFIKGMGDGRFGAGEAITRQDMAVMVYNVARANGALGAPVRQTEFADADDAADYARESIAALAESGLIVGSGDGRFNPTDRCTRAEMAVVIHRALNTASAER